MTAGSSRAIPLAITDFFIAEDWAVSRFDSDAPAPGVRGAFKGDSGEWIVDVMWFDDVEELVVHSTVARPVPDDRRAPVAGYLTFVNFGLTLGSIEVSPVSGELRARTGVAVSQAQLTEDLVARQVYANVLTLDRYLPGVIQVVWGTEPHVAYAAIDGLEGVDRGGGGGDAADAADAADGGTTAE